MLAHYFLSKVDVEVCDWELLTKHENATYLTFTVVVVQTSISKKTIAQRNPAVPGKRERTNSNVSPATNFTHRDNATTSRTNETSYGTEYPHIHKIIP